MVSLKKKKKNKKKLTSLFIIDMKNHAINPSVVTYEHDTRRLRHALPPLVTTLDSIQCGVCDPPTSPPLLPPYFNARVNLLWTRLGLQLALSFFLSSCPFRRCPMARNDATFVQCASLVHLPPRLGSGTSENIGSPCFCFFS